MSKETVDYEFSILRKVFTFPILDLQQSCIITDYISNITFLHKGNYTNDILIEITIKINENLKHIHSACIVHRDLKLINVMLTSSFEVRMIDFGLSTDLTNRCYHSYYTLGSPSFVDPEIWRVIGEIDEDEPDKFYYKIDIYALGIIFYMMFNKLKHPYPEIDLTTSLTLNWIRKD